MLRLIKDETEFLRPQIITQVEGDARYLLFFLIERDIYVDDYNQRLFSHLAAFNTYMNIQRHERLLY